MVATNMNKTIKRLETLFEGQADAVGSGKADLSNLRNLLENSEHVPLDVCFAQLKADLSGDKSPRHDNGKSEERLQRIMNR